MVTDVPPTAAPVAGAMLVTARPEPAAVARYENALGIEADTPPDVTTTGTVPTTLAGEVAVISVEFTTTTFVAGVPPTSTAEPAANP